MRAKKGGGVIRPLTHAAARAGYYHYSTGVDTSLSYEELLPFLVDYFANSSIPFGHIQFDSWFCTFT